MNASSLTISAPPFSRSLTFVLSAAGFMAIRTFGASPGVTMSREAKWIWNAETPASVPAGARISAGKSGRVARSFPRTAVALVNRSPVSCMPSPESPANRTTTRSFSTTVFGAISLLQGTRANRVDGAACAPQLLYCGSAAIPSVKRAFGSKGGEERLVERMAAGAAARGHRIVDGEPGCLERVDEVDLRFLQVGDAHPVDHHADAELLGGLVGVGQLVIQVHGVPEPRATARLDRHAEGDVEPALLLEKFLHLAG